MSSIKCASTEMYAVPASNVDASIFAIVPNSGIPVMFLETSVQLPLAPPSRVYQSLPSFVPAHTSPSDIGEGVIANTTSGANCPRLSPTMPPDEIILVLS